MAKYVILPNGVKVFMMLICIGWVSLWILKPTRVWTRKWKEAEDLFRPTFFGYYGLDFVVFSFPVIAVAIFGCIYMNMKLKKPKMRNGNKAFSGLSNPLIVNTLVGTLSTMEILSITLFAIFLAWTFYTRISNDLKKLTPIKSLKLELWQLKYMRVATRFGLLSEACLALLILPILRGLSVFRLVGVQLEASVRYHVWLGTTMICFATIHGLSTLFIWGLSHQIQDQIWKWQKKGRIYLAGEISLAVGLVIWVTSLPQIRRRKFEIFYYTHHLYIVFFVFFLFHTGDRHFYSVFGGIFLFGLDKLLRIIQSRPDTCVLSAKIFPCKAIELVLPKDPKLKYTPTSVVFIKVPSISKLEWHSFSITSSSSFDDHTMSLLIKCQGSWTNSLYNVINSEIESESNSAKSLAIAVEGPYGPASTQFLRYDSLLLVAGGIGITPFLSIIQEISSFPKNFSHLPTKIQLIYVVKNSQDICLLNSISNVITNQPSEQFDLKLKVYVTQEQQSGSALRELMNEYSQAETVHFDTDSSSHAINGLESFVSTALVVGISSIVFLVFLIGLNHIFVPNLKSKTAKEAKEKTPSSVVDLIIICSFLVAMISASLAALFVRRRRMKRGVVVPPVSEKHFNSWQETSIESGLDLDRHEIHFTGRPNFQDIFTKFRTETETDGSDIGVLACGPETMKESVALICRINSESLFKIGSQNKKKNTNFNFHSLNFSL